jgi:hypothetical protein
MVSAPRFGYAGSMDASIQLHPGQLYLILAPRSAGRKLANAFIARLALAGEVRVLDGGNLFDFHTIARSVRRETYELEAALERICVARAFTCYQMVALLVQTPTSQAPTLVLDLLSTFYDENVPLLERLRLLEQSLAQLRRLSQPAPVVVSAAGSPADPSGELLARLETEADHVLRLEPPVQVVQERLF